MNLFRLFVDYRILPRPCKFPLTLCVLSASANFGAELAEFTPTEVVSVKRSSMQVSGAILELSSNLQQAKGKGNCSFFKKWLLEKKSQKQLYIKKTSMKCFKGYSYEIHFVICLPMFSFVYFMFGCILACNKIYLLLNWGT